MLHFFFLLTQLHRFFHLPCFMLSCDDLPPLSRAKCTDRNLINVCLLLCAAALWAASLVVRDAEGGWISVSWRLACA